MLPILYVYSLQKQCDLHYINTDADLSAAQGMEMRRTGETSMSSLCLAFILSYQSVILEQL